MMSEAPGPPGKMRSGVRVLRVVRVVRVLRAQVSLGRPEVA